MATYKPNMPAAHWLPIRDFVVASTLADLPQTVPQAQKLAGVLARYARWVTTVASIPLDPTDMFQPGNVARFVELTYKENSWRSYAEALLRRVAEAYGDSPEVRKVTRTAREPFPYSESEIAGLYSWAAGFPFHTTNANAILGMCGGAGLRPQELIQSKVGDVHETTDGFEVDIRGKYPRTIPVRAGWESAVRAAIADREQDELIVFPHLRLSTRLDALGRFGNRNFRGAPRAQRLRITWVVAMLETLPIASFVYACGYSGVQSAAPYFSMAAPLAEDQLHSLLRNPVQRGN